MKELIPLETWADRRYPVGRPHIQTLRRWAREGRIQPQPEKHGRNYYVTPEAEYLSTARLVQRLQGVAQAS